jgi:hypothetical protein
VADPQRISEVGQVGGTFATANRYVEAITCMIDGAVRLTVGLYAD